jgi:hypothetical protein
MVTSCERRLIPLPLEIAYTVFIAVLVPCYLSFYGPANFCATSVTLMVSEATQGLTR